MRTIAILFLLCSCSSPQRSLLKVKKYWGKIETELLKHPEIADSINMVKRDTVFVEKTVTTLEAKNDSTVWDDIFFHEVDTLAKAVTEAKPEEKAKPVAKLQRLICPELVKDSTYHVRVYNSAISIYVPVHLQVKAKDGKIRIGIVTGDVKVPDPRVIKSIEFKPVHPQFYRDQWFWVAVMLLVMLLTTLWGLATRSRK